MIATIRRRAERTRYGASVKGVERVIFYGKSCDFFFFFSLLLLCAAAEQVAGASVKKDHERNVTIG